MSTSGSAERLITVGEIRGVHGVQGSVKLFSWTSPRANLLNYSEFIDARGRTLTLEAGREQGKTLVGRFRGVDDRDAALAMSGTLLQVRRDQLPAAAEGEYYWADLIGAAVENEQGERLGTVDYLLETGANDVMVLKRDDGGELLLPFVIGDVVRQVDVDGAKITVAWQGGDGTAG